jgi:hypothetical protein
VLAPTSTAAMKSRRLVISRKLALMASRAVCLSVMAASPLAGRGGRRAKTPAQAVPIQSQVHNMANTRSLGRRAQGSQARHRSDNWRRVVRTFPEQKRHIQDKKEALSRVRH